MKNIYTVFAICFTLLYLSAFGYETVRLDAPNGGFNYQWYLNDGSGSQPIPGATGVTLLMSDPGLYYATYDRVGHSEISQYVMTTCDDCEDTIVVLSIGSCTGSIQWYRMQGASAIALPGETTEELLTTATASVETYFAQIVSGGVTSTTASYMVMRMTTAPPALVGPCGTIHHGAATASYADVYMNNGTETAVFGPYSFEYQSSGELDGLVGINREGNYGRLSFVPSAPQPTGMSDTGYVDGYVRRYGADRTFEYPVGDNGQYRPASTIANSLTCAGFTDVAYYGVNPSVAMTSNLAGGSYSVLPASGPFTSVSTIGDLVAVSTIEYWDINGTENVQIQLTWNANSNVSLMTTSDLSNLRIVGWNGTAWETIAASLEVGASLMTGAITTDAAIIPNDYEVYTLAGAEHVDVLAINDINVSLYGATVTGNVLTNDIQTSGDSLYVNTSGTVMPQNGTLTINPDGSYNYTPIPGFTGQDQFTYVVCDVNTPQNCDTANVVVQVVNDPIAGVNDQPIANDDTYINVSGQTTTGQTILNDTDPDGDPLTLSVVDNSGLQGGSLSFNPDGSFTYTSVGGFIGTASFTYMACDTATPALCDTALVVIEVQGESPVNSPPFAADDASIGIDTLVGFLLQNDMDPDGSPLVLNTTTVDGPDNGHVFINSDGSFMYIPNDGFVGVDQFIYEICDTNTPAACAQATAYMEVVEKQLCISVWAYLEGNFRDNGDTMTTLLNHFCSVIPNTNPYSMDPWQYTGKDSVNTIPQGVVDWVLLSTRNDVTNDSTTDMIAALLYTDGLIKTTDGEEVICMSIAGNDSVYVVIEHRNHIAAMSADKLRVPNDEIVPVDFRTNQSFQVGGIGFQSAAQKIVGTHDVHIYNLFALYSGDPIKVAAGKNDVNSNDIAALLLDIGQFGQYHLGDHNLDCDLNSNDLPFVLNNLAKTSVVD